MQSCAAEPVSYTHLDVYKRQGWAGKGELDVGKDADLVLLDGDYQVARTVVGGRTVYTR